MGKILNRSQAVLVLGMHRTGTSAITGCLNALGVKLGPKIDYSNDENPKGFFENYQVIDINDNILKELGYSWANPYYKQPGLEHPVFKKYYNNAVSVLRESYSSYPLWGLKDPRICLLLPFWRKIIEKELGAELKIIYSLRSPFDVAKSLKKRSEKHSEYVCGYDSQSFVLWFLHYAFALKAAPDVKSLVVSFEKIISAPLVQFERISNFLKVKPDKEELKRFSESFLDKKLVHHATPGNDRVLESDFTFVFDLYDRLRVQDDASCLSKDKMNNFLLNVPNFHSFQLLDKFSAEIFREIEGYKKDYIRNKETNQQYKDCLIQLKKAQQRLDSMELFSQPLFREISSNIRACSLIPNKKFKKRNFSRVLKSIKNRTKRIVSDYNSNVSELIKKSGLFDIEYYHTMINQHFSCIDSAIEYYVNHSLDTNISPSPLFDSEYYHDLYPDIVANKINAFIHFVRFGHLENRRPNRYFDSKWYRKTYSEFISDKENPLSHYLKTGWLQGCEPSSSFEGKWYLKHYVDVKDAHINPLVHFLKYGEKEGRHPSRPRQNKSLSEKFDQLEKHFGSVNKYQAGQILSDYKLLMTTKAFDSSFYSSYYKDIKTSGCDPLLHYCAFGWKEKRFPSANYNERVYISNELNLNENLNPQVLRVLGNRSRNKYRQACVACSVIIPTYNRADKLVRLLEAWEKVSSITPLSFEIIFCDDGSTDNTISILKKHKQSLPLTVLQLDHGGAGNARNAGVLQAQGDVILFWGDDMLPDPRILVEHAALHSKLPEYVAVLGSAPWGQELFKNYLMYHITDVGCEQFEYGRLVTGQLYDYKYFYTCNISIKRNFLLREKLCFDPIFKLYGFEDIELSYRLKNHGLNIYYHKAARGFHYHSYTFKGFCQRQLSAGKMAVVFSQLHGDRVESLTSVKRLTYHYQKNYENSDRSQKYTKIVNRLFDFISLFDELEHDTLPFEIASSLSFIYSACFSCFYNTGLISEYFSIDCDSLLSEYFIHEYCTEILVRYLENIVDYCFSQKTNDFSNLDYMWLIDLKLHINKSPKIYIQVNLEDVHLYNERYEKLKQVEVVSGLDCIVESPDVWVYCPESIDVSMSPDQLDQVILAATLYSQICNVIIVSNSLLSDGVVQTCDKHGCIVKRLPLVHSNIMEDNITGKVLRLLPSPDNKQGSTYKISEVLGREVNLYKEGFFRTFSGYLCPYSVEVNLYEKLIKRFEVDKPVVFVLPTFLANGGVERNLATVVAKLQSQYQFVLINTEKLQSGYGDLYSIFYNLHGIVIDLAEITLHKNYLDTLVELKRVYSPAAVWICNGSSWLLDNACILRELFCDIPIVDQQVYDTTHGWIYGYNDPGIRSFDRFIAINRPIMQTMIEDYQIDKSRIDLIYPILDHNRVCYTNEKLRSEVAESFGLNPDIKYFATIGRIAEQKRPMLFLQMVEKVSHYRDDIQFLMIGGGPLENEVDALIAEKQLKVKRIGVLDNVKSILPIIDGIVFTSLYEGLPIASLEALGSSIPVFSTDVGEVEWLIKTYNAGKVVPVNSSLQDLAEKFIDFICDVENGVYSDNSFSSSILRDFSADSIAEKYVACWSKAMSNYYM